MGFRPCMITTIIAIWLEIFLVLSDASQFDYDDYSSFYQNYNVTWGRDHVRLLNHGQVVQLSLDEYSGAGFASKAYYGSGFFQMRIKLPRGDSGGVVTSFTLKGSRDELHFEFLGNTEGKPTRLQTNIFLNGRGNREQRFKLWFDPSTKFHYYKLLWNRHQIVFFVDNVPIRVFKNDMNSRFENDMNSTLRNDMNTGVGYPRRAMKVVVSIWDGSNWATDGGRTRVDWFSGPFRSLFQDFRIDGCPTVRNSRNRECYSSMFSWNNKRNLTPTQQNAYEKVKRRYMTYDYCTDHNRHPYNSTECFGDGEIWNIHQ